jgi:hypothetical protein
MSSRGARSDAAIGDASTQLQTPWLRDLMKGMRVHCAGARTRAWDVLQISWPRISAALIAQCHL